MSAPTLLRVRESFAYMVGNYPDVLRTGDVVSSDHPAVKGRADKFEPVTTDNALLRDPNAALVQASGVIEQATSAPGERRSVSRPRKRVAKKAAPKKAVDVSPNAD
ncbi:MAG: hypothetical protein AB7G17_14375 [Phycisphaerales bacterium]